MITITYFWDTEACAMRPLARFREAARRQFVNGAEYPMEVSFRSDKSHRHYFAAINEAWKNLPEDMQEDYPTSEHLRKRALIKCGYHNVRAYTCDSPEHAESVASIVKPMDEFAVIVVKGSVVKIFTAQSQSHDRMTPDVFKASKEAVLDLLASYIGVKRSELEKEGRHERS